MLHILALLRFPTLWLPTGFWRIMNRWNIWLGFFLWVKPAALSFLPPLCILRLLGGGPESSTRGGVCLRNTAKETNGSQRALNLGRWENAEHCNGPNAAPVRDAISLGLQSSGRNFNFSHPADDRQIFLTSAVMCSPPKCFLKPVKHSLGMPTSSSWRMEKQACWHQQVGTRGCRFHWKDSLLDGAGPCSLSQAVGPVVTQEGMPPTSRGHARELLSTCQQVTSYGNQMRANLRALCVTAYVDLGLSSRGLSFTFSWAHSQGPSCGAPPLLASAESRSSKSQSSAVPSGWCRALPGSAVSRTSHSSFRLAPLLHASWFLPVGQWCGWRSVLFLLGHLIVFPGIVMAFGCTSLMIEICWLTTADITKFCSVLAVGIGKVLTASSIWAVWGPLQGQRSLKFLRHLTPASGLSPADITRAKSLMDLT